MDARCFYCGHLLEWNNDEMASDVFGETEDNKDKVTSLWTCPECGTEYLVTY